MTQHLAGEIHVSTVRLWIMLLKSQKKYAGIVINILIIPQNFAQHAVSRFVTATKAFIAIAVFPPANVFKAVPAVAADALFIMNTNNVHISIPTGFRNVV